MITLEIGEPKASHPCPDCGAENEVVYGFLYQHGDACAIYHSMFSWAHHDRGASLRIIIGEWSEDTDPTSRFSFGLEVRSTAEDYEFMLVGPERSVWEDSTLSAPMLTREQALVHPAKNEVFHMAEHVVNDDPRIRSFLQGNPQAA